MRIAIINICFAFVVLSSSLFAQPAKAKWDVSLSYGFAIPAGGFSKFDPEKSLFTSVSPTGISRTDAYGFRKENSGYAKSGQFASFKIAYHLSRHWFATAAAFHSINSVNTDVFLDYVNQVTFPLITSLTNEDYRVSGWAVGAGYRFYYSHLSFSFAPLVGQAVIAPPSYTFQWFGYPFDYPVISLTDSPLVGFTSDLRFSTNRSLYTSFKLDYASANFHYKSKLKSPGLSVVEGFDDVITYRLLSVGITVGYKF
jgi:hypothetical protein